MSSPDGAGQISPTQLGFFAATLLFAPFALTFPRDGIAFAPFSAPICLLLVFGFTLATAWAVTSLGSRFAGQTPGAWMGALAGPFGTAYSIALALFAVLLSAVVLREVANIVRVEFLDATPLWAVEAAIALTAAYTASQGVEGLGRAITLLFSAAWVGFAAAYVLTLTRVYHWSLVVPALPVPLSDLFPFLYPMTILGFGLSLLWVYLPYNPDRRSSYRGAAGGITAVFFIMGLILVDVLGTFGPFAISSLTWPPVTVIRVSSFQGLLIPRLGLFAAVLWPGLAAIQMGSYLLAFSLIVKEHVRATNVQRAQLLPLTFAGAAAAVLLAQLPASNVAMHDLVYQYLLPGGVLVTFVAPWGFLLLASVRPGVRQRKRALF